MFKRTVTFLSVLILLVCLVRSFVKVWPGGGLPARDLFEGSEGYSTLGSLIPIGLAPIDAA